jgi:hypothetical protein
MGGNPQVFGLLEEMLGSGKPTCCDGRRRAC